MKASELNRLNCDFVPALRNTGTAEYAPTVFRHRPVIGKRNGRHASRYNQSNERTRSRKPFHGNLPLQKEVFEQDSQVEFILNDSQSPTTHPDSSLQTEKGPEVEDKEDMENNAAPDTLLYWWVRTMKN